MTYICPCCKAPDVHVREGWHCMVCLAAGPVLRLGAVLGLCYRASVRPAVPAPEPKLSPKVLAFLEALQ